MIVQHQNNVAAFAGNHVAFWAGQPLFLRAPVTATSITPTVPGVLLSGTFTGVGVSPNAIKWTGAANLFIDGGKATISVERSFDNGNNFSTILHPANTNLANDQETFIIPSQLNGDQPGYNGTITEIEFGVCYRLNCLAYVSGTVTFRISR